MEYFDAFGLPPTLTVDPPDLQKRFYALSRQWHPDKFTGASSAEQQIALDKTALLNDAFRVLRDPTARVEYFLEQNGIPSSKAPPAELLEEVFELNMMLEELKGGDQSQRPQLIAAHDNFQQMRTGIDQNIAQLSALYDSRPEPSLLAKIRAAVDRRRYVSNLLRDVEKELGV